MIVNYRKDGWEVITQRAHGLLAAQIGAQWRLKDRGKRWTETLVAIADHDDAQIELERNDLLTTQGGPMDFKMRAFTLEHGERTMAFSLSKSRYVALLSSMHLEFIAADVIEDHKAFFTAQKTLRKTWRSELGITEKEACFDYALLEWCDALSLLICQHENQPEQRSVEISSGPDNRNYCMVQTGENQLSVNPWPFATDEFEIRFEWRMLPQLAYKDCKEFKKSWEEATVTENTWILKK